MIDTDTLTARIDACWQAVRREVAGLDLAAEVYPDSGWAVRDVLLHCAFWNDEATRAIEAHRAGGCHVTDTGAPTFDEGLDALNARVVKASRAVPDADVHARWIAAQDAFTAAVASLDHAALARDIMCPWDERGTVEELVDGELGHEQGHVADIVTAVAMGEGQR